MKNRILVIDLAYLGDIVTMNPALDVIARQYPDHKLTVVTQLNCEIGIKYHPAVERIVLWDKLHRNKDLFRFYHSCRNLDKSPYQIAFAFHNSFKAALISFFANSKRRVGYKNELRQFLLTHSYPLPKKRMHLMDVRLNLLELFGINVTPNDYTTYKMHLPDSIIEETKEKFLKNLPPLPIVLISVAASWPTKTWLPTEMNRLIDKFSNNSVIFILIGKDDPFEHYIGSLITKKKNLLINLIGQTTPTELAGLIGCANLIIAPDNGAMHLASALNRPLVAIFAPTDPQLCGPRSALSRIIEASVPCTKCYLKHCPQHQDCMSTITAERVLEKIKELTPELV